MRPKCRGTAVLQLLTLLSALIVQFHSQAKAQARQRSIRRGDVSARRVEPERLRGVALD